MVKCHVPSLGGDESTFIGQVSLRCLLQAVITSKTGTVNNVIQVKRTDFEVFDALRLDSQDSDISGCLTRITSLQSLVTLAATWAPLYSSDALKLCPVVPRLVQFSSRPLPTGGVCNQVRR